MLDFEQTLLEGLGAHASISTKKLAQKRPAQTRPAPKKPAPKKTPKKTVVKAQIQGRFSGKLTAPKSIGLGRQIAAAIKKPEAKLALISAARQGIPVVTAARIQAAKKVIAARAHHLLGKKRLPQSPSPQLRLFKPLTAKAVSKKAAVGVTTKLVKALAAKPPFTPASQTNRSKAQTAIAPIAQSCKCQQAETILPLVAQKLAAQGYPPNTAQILLAGFTDLNKQVEKAATKRLATHEHKYLDAQHKFEHEVLRRLANIAQKLPECHPTRARANLTILKKANHA